MTGEEEADRLYELADLVHALARQLPAPADLRPGPCTPVEISVMRFVGRNPGTLAGAAAEATRLATSNFSRVVNGLVAKGLLVRRADERDARNVHLFPTELAKVNRSLMRAAWSDALAGTVADPSFLPEINEVLRDIERALTERIRSGKPSDVAAHLSKKEP